MGSLLPGADRDGLGGRLYARAELACLSSASASASAYRPAGAKTRGVLAQLSTQRNRSQPLYTDHCTLCAINTIKRRAGWDERMPGVPPKGERKIDAAAAALPLLTVLHTLR